MPSPSFAQRLLVVTSAPGMQVEGKLVLDKKFVEGMRYYATHWGGPVSCLIRDTGETLPFSDSFPAAELPFGVHVRSADHEVNGADLVVCDVVMAGADSADCLHLTDLCRQHGKKIYYAIENIPLTRRQFIELDTGRSWLRKKKAILQIGLQERRRRRAFIGADGLQANGGPAARLYGPLNPNTLLYFDTRINAELLATPDEMRARRKHLTSGAPLRLVHSGRLERLKGSQDLVAVCQQLQELGVPTTLDVFGTGSLEDQIRQDIAKAGLEGSIRLHGAVDFASELVPWARKHADIFLSCHRQSDPSCSYLENMGCGLAIAGYDNLMWKALAEDSQAGWTAPLGNADALAQVIATAAKERPTVADRCDAALRFATNHLFEDEFRRRLDQMRA